MGEFDKNRMIRAQRYPLGIAAKVFRQKGDIDMNGKPAPKAGWYYLWYRGLQLLCGEEGKVQFMHRPSYEDKHGEIVTWKVENYAVIQLYPGHPEDTTIEDAYMAAGKQLSPRLIKSLHWTTDPTNMATSKKTTPAKGRSKSIGKEETPIPKKRKALDRIQGKFGDDAESSKKAAKKAGTRSSASMDQDDNTMETTGMEGMEGFFTINIWVVLTSPQQSEHPTVTATIIMGGDSRKDSEIGWGGDNDMEGIKHAEIEAYF